MALRQIVTVPRVTAVAGLLVVALLLAFAALAAARPDEQPPAPAALPVATIPIEPVEGFVQPRTYTGVIKAARHSELGFERTGRLIEVAVDEGQTVSAGDVLARLDTRNLEARLRELTAQREAAQALLEELEFGPRKEAIAAAAAEVHDLEAQLKLADLNLARSENLLQARAVAQEEYDRFAYGKRSTAARLEAARHRLDELQAGTRKERIAAQRAVVEQLDASIENTQIDLEESRLIAPYDGMVARRRVDEGTIVAPGTSLLRLVERKRLEAWIGVPAHVALQIEVGCEFPIDVEGERAMAVAERLHPELDATTRTRTVVFRLADAGHSVVPAQVARITLGERIDARGYWVPTTALSRGVRGLWSVMVAEQSEAGGETIAARRDIELLHTDGERALVRGTLDLGDRVIVGGTHRLVAGQRVDTRR